MELRISIRMSDVSEFATPVCGSAQWLGISEESRKLFSGLFREHMHSSRVAWLDFSKHEEAVKKNGYLQARYYEDSPETLSKFLSYEYVFRINPYEIGARRDVSRKEFASMRKEILELFELRGLMRSSFISLSNGETRRALIAREILKKPTLALLFNPDAGLDPERRKKLKVTLETVARRFSIAIISAIENDDTGAPISTAGKTSKNVSSQKRPKAVVEINNLFIKYRKKPLFDKFSWKVCEGERWIVSGPNGSGKTTLLSLIIGDNPLAYANDIKVLSIPRKVGFELAKVRPRIGISSPEMQAYLSKSPMDLLDEALSTKRDILLLDEPFLNMDCKMREIAQKKILDYLARYPHCAAILVTHRNNEVMPGFDRHLQLSGKNEPYYLRDGGCR